MTRPYNIAFKRNDKLQFEIPIHFPYQYNTTRSIRHAKMSLTEDFFIDTMEERGEIYDNLSK